MKTKATLKNSFAGIVYYIVTVITGILLRRAVINYLGIEYQGIDGLFTSVITMLSISELGIGTAIISSLYEPLAKGDLTAVQGLMRFYKKCYRWIACIVLALGLLLIPFLPFVVKDYRLPLSLVSVYLWFLADSVLSYFLSYRRSILVADQRNYVVFIADTVYVLTTKLLQGFLIIRTRNYYLLLAAGVFMHVLENTVLYIYTGKQYPYLRNTDAGELRRELLEDVTRKVKGAVFHKIGGFVVNSTDSILISGYLGLVYSGIYSNYFIIIRAIQNLCSRTISAATASIGHMLTEGNQKNSREVFGELQLINLTLTCISVTGVYAVCSDVVAYLFGSEFTVNRFTMFWISLNLAVQSMREVYKAYKEAAGILYEDRFIPLIESAVNIIASILFLQKFGLAGIFMGTVACELVLYLYTYPVFIYKGLLGGSYRSYLKEMFWRLGVILVTMFAGEMFCSRILAEVTLRNIMIKAVLCAVTASAGVFLLYAIWRQERKELFGKIRRLYNKRAE